MQVFDILQDNVVWHYYESIDDAVEALFLVSMDPVVRHSKASELAQELAQVSSFSRHINIYCLINDCRFINRTTSPPIALHAALSCDKSKQK